MSTGEADTQVIIFVKNKTKAHSRYKPHIYTSFSQPWRKKATAHPMKITRYGIWRRQCQL